MCKGISGWLSVSLLTCFKWRIDGEPGVLDHIVLLIIHVVMLPKCMGSAGCFHGFHHEQHQKCEFFASTNSSSVTAHAITSPQMNF